MQSSILLMSFKFFKKEERNALEEPLLCDTKQNHCQLNYDTVPHGSPVQCMNWPCQPFLAGNCFSFLLRHLVTSPAFSCTTQPVLGILFHTSQCKTEQFPLSGYIKCLAVALQENMELWSKTNICSTNISENPTTLCFSV